MEFDCEDFELVPPKPGFIDKTAYTIALLIRDELLHKHGPCELVLDCLTSSSGCTFCGHTLHIHRQREISAIVEDFRPGHGG